MFVLNILVLSQHWHTLFSDLSRLHYILQMRKQRLREDMKMDTFGRSQRRIAPDAMASRAEQKPPRRAGESGWTMSLHPLQVLAWAVLVIIVTTAFIFFIPLLPDFWKDIAFMVIGGLFVLHILTYVVTCCVCTDHPNALLIQKSSERIVPLFIDPVRTHLLPDQYCHLCHITPWWSESLSSAVAFLCCVLVVVLYIMFLCMVNRWEICKDPGLPGPKTSPSQGVTPEPTSQPTSLPMDTPKPDAWLRSLPCSTIRRKKPAFLVLLVVTLLLDVISLVVLVKLLISHLCLVKENKKAFVCTCQKRQSEGSPQRAVDQPQEIGFLDSKGAGHESPATGDDPPVPAEGSTWLELFNSEALGKPLPPRTPSPSSHSPSAPELLGTIQEGHKPQSLGLNAGARKSKEPSFHLGCDLQQDPLPESKQDESMDGDSAAGGETAAGGDMPSSQVATDLPAAQGEVRIDLSPVLSLHKSEAIPVDDDIGI
ncbi:putative palmitoyltransferase ZDHHC11B isoform X2 [Tamandua tetradactyla]|uniref:putative palmitoyltransferase ZDHHC11B isoform X2 n=1 Tax=Tamandua tetradactyla TaxID=48850 RepID=UPI004054474F